MRNYEKINNICGLKFCIDRFWDILKIKPFQWIFKNIPWYLIDNEEIYIRKVNSKFYPCLIYKGVSLSIFNIHICNIYFYNIPIHYTLSKEKIIYVICEIINRKLNMQLIEFEDFRNDKFELIKADIFMKERLKEKYEREM